MEPTTALLTDPMAVFAYLAAVLGLIFWASGLPRMRKFFELTPPVIYAYFIPTISTTLGITPSASPAYDWMVRYLLPVALLLLMITIDLRSVAKLGWMALVMVVVGTLGIVIGGPIAYLLFSAWLPENAWMGFAALSGSWIGGTANMVAIAESVGTPDSLMGPIIVVDTVVGYGWMGVLLFFSAWQQRFDRKIGARTEALEETNQRLAEAERKRHPVSLPWLAAIVGVGFAGAVLAVALGEAMPPLGDPTIISQTTWAVLIVVTGGLLLSFTPITRLEEHGASRVGYLALYMLLTAIGARADLAAVLAAPAFLAAGVVWIAIHVGLLLIAARLIRAPLFFVATGSMANIGGAASAPIVAGVYHPAMAPVGLLMAVVGYVLGIYAALGCAWLLAIVGG
ncbi:MAG TPA: DUF819 family protein [Longimicrobiales bacterium]|nr:DUF819 family protein [Longimicrobiales bacterium]